METYQTLMQKEWNARAKANAMHYIASGRDTWTLPDFFASGEQEVAEFTDRFFQRMGFNPSGARMLEIGCGIGRMTLAFARRFEHVDGLDVSDEMIAQARQTLGAVPNITWAVGNGADLATYANQAFDFVFSYIVFQHIPKHAIVLNYIAEIGRVLKPGGLYKFQVYTHPGWLERTRTLASFHTWRLLWKWLHISRGQVLKAADHLDVEDALKAEHYRTWVGNPIPLQRLVGALESVGLDYDIENPGTQYTWVSGRKRG